VTSINPPKLTVEWSANKPKMAAAPDAKWVWSNDCSKTNGPGIINITQQFRLSCNGPVTIYGTADDYSIAYINDVKVL
jgi:hypothetical protein